MLSSVVMLLSSLLVLLLVSELSGKTIAIRKVIYYCSGRGVAAGDADEVLLLQIAGSEMLGEQEHVGWRGAAPGPARGTTTEPGGGDGLQQPTRPKGCRREAMICSRIKGGWRGDLLELNFPWLRRTWANRTARLWMSRMARLWAARGWTRGSDGGKEETRPDRIVLLWCLRVVGSFLPCLIIRNGGSIIL